MTTLLIGSNFSGRSAWLAERRQFSPWPKIGFLGPLADTASTGLAWTLREELRIAAIGSPRNQTLSTDIVDALELEHLLDRELHTLSGGETVRAAVASTVMQGVIEVQIDTAFEQLDAQWRPRMMSWVRKNFVAQHVFLADNHLSPEEIGQFDDKLEFPVTRDRHANAPVLDPPAAAARIADAAPIDIELNEVSFRYRGATQLVLDRVSVKLEAGKLYFLQGPNGSGKSTFVKLLSGAIVPERGNVTFGSTKFSPRRADRFAALAFQNPDYQWTSQSLISELPTAKDERPTAIEKLVPFGLALEWMRAGPIDLPFTAKKRLGIALAALGGKPWIVLDEPTLGQDLKFRNGLAVVLRTALAKGLGVLGISHDEYFRSQFPSAQKMTFADGTVSQR